MQVNINQLEIPKASTYAVKALEIISDEEPDLKELESAIMHDPLLASSLLRYANSPLHRRDSEVSNVPTALRLLGLKSVKSAIVTATIRSLLPTDNRLGNIILSHMLNISAICKLISQRCCKDASEDIEFLGLIHDVGMLTLAANYEETYLKLISDARTQNKPIDNLERQEFGISHNQVTARTAAEFRIPKKHTELLMDFHSRPDVKSITEERDRDCCILALAHKILDEILYDENAENNYGSIAFLETTINSREELSSLLGLGQEDIDVIRQHAETIVADNMTSL